MRVSFIDKLKGLAIIFVVMGHVTEYGLGVKSSPFNLFYHSFHMPLFMFLSGLFAYKSFRSWNLQETLVFLRKKALRILLPFVVVGGGYVLLILKNSVAEVVDYVRLCGVYWFFPALFYCMFTGLLMGILSFKLGSNKSQGVKVIIDFIMCCLVVSSIYMLDRVCGLRNIIPYFGDYTAMFPFFYMGVLCSRHKLVKSVVFQSELMYTFAVILYLCAMLWLGGDRKFSGCFIFIRGIQFGNICVPLVFPSCFAVIFARFNCFASSSGHIKFKSYFIICHVFSSCSSDNWNMHYSNYMYTKKSLLEYVCIRIQI